MGEKMREKDIDERKAKTNNQADSLYIENVVQWRNGNSRFYQ